MKLEKCALHKLKTLSYGFDPGTRDHIVTATYVGNLRGKPLEYQNCEHTKVTRISENMLNKTPLLVFKDLMAFFIPGVVCRIG